SSTFTVGEEIPFEEVGPLLVGLGYADEGAVDEPGRFSIRGDTVDIFPAQDTSPVRIEFFGDEVDRIRRMVASTRQTIGELEEIEIMPARELALTPDTIERARRRLWAAAQEDTRVAADLELIEAASSEPSLDRYLRALYGMTDTPLAHMCPDTLVVLAEPRALFDDCQRYAEEINAAAVNAGEDIEGLFAAPRDLDFGTQQRLTFASFTMQGRSAGIELQVRQPAIAGSDTRFLGRVRSFVRDGFTTVFCVPDRGARSSLMLRFSDESIPFMESLGAVSGDGSGSDVPDRISSIRSYSARRRTEPLEPGYVTFTDAAVPAGCVIPSARLAVLSVADLSSRGSATRQRRRIDITEVTFPFKPGDYVVHATHGIALFSAIVRQEVSGKERDHFLLEYAEGDKLYVPLEQVDRITRYVGPDGSDPRLTRLNTADWSRATGKARRSAKKLAFDLVDLYTRRASAIGHAFPPDTPDQIEMESSFPFDMTPDQENALADIKADMETTRPMDRLLCGDVGFGKT
ncbi:MAG: transcription-repair coupling factor, partial [Atopobiaceae bacterium]|nr:transcription-repair coupling factor [Atopobiaceae bacterium]